jgi:WD40 repeat protein
MPIVFLCVNPSCRRKFTVADNLAGRRARCQGCNLTMRIPQPSSQSQSTPQPSPAPQPAAVPEFQQQPFSLGDVGDADTPPPPRKRRPRPERDEDPRDEAASTERRKFPTELAAGAVMVFAFLAFLAVGYWWIGQPSSAQEASYATYLKTGEELIEMHEAVKTKADAAQAEPKMMEKAQENLDAWKQMQQVTGRKKKALEEKYEEKLRAYNERRFQLVKDFTSGKCPLLVGWGSTSKHGGVTFVNSDSFFNSSGPGELTTFRLGDFGTAVKPPANPPVKPPVTAPSKTPVGPTVTPPVTPAVTPPSGVPTDPALAGNWKLKELYDEYGDGKKSFLLVSSRYEWSIKDGKLAVVTDSKRTEFDFETDVAAKPHTLLRYLPGKRDTPEVGAAIYEFRSGGLWVCIQGGQKPPPDFITSRDTTPDRQIMVFERIGPPPFPPPSPTPGGTGPLVIDVHKKGVFSLAVSADGKTVITGDERTAACWRADGKVMSGLGGHRGPVRFVALSPDGKVAASSSGADGDTRIWEAASATVVKELPGRCQGLAFSADGTELYVEAGGVLQVYSAETGNGVRKFNDMALVESNGLYTEMVPDSMVSAGDGKNLYFGFRDGGLRRWDLATGKKAQTFGELNLSVRNSVFGIAPRPRGGVVTASSDNTIRDWKAGGELEASFKLTDQKLTAVAVCPSTGAISIGTEEGPIHIWRAGAKKTRLLEGHPGRVSALAYLPDGRLVSVGGDGKMKVWPADSPSTDGVAIAGPVAPPPPPKQEPPKKEPPKAAGAVKLGDLKVAKTTADPPSVTFTVKLELNGAELLEGWASVDVEKSEEVLKIFAGAIDQGLLSFTIDGVTIDFANPPGDLKAQRVSFRKSETDPTAYTCEVKFPKVKTRGDVTTFGVIVAARSGDKVVHSNGLEVRVNLKSGGLVK